MKGFFRFLASDSGQAMLETAFSLPVFAMLLAGVIDLGRLSQFDMRLLGSARAGAQYGSQNATDAADTTGMNNAALTFNPNVTVTSSSFYKCADGVAPPTPPPVLTMATTSSINCSTTHQLLYVVVTTTATFQPLFYRFLSLNHAQSRTVIMEVG